MSKCFTAVILSLLVTAGAFVAFGQGVPAPYTLRLQPFLTGLTRPILIRHDGPGPGRRMFIVEQSGNIKLLKPGSTTPTVFINLSSKIVIPGSPGDERGLLGMTVHRLFDSNGKFYVNYTRVGDGATVVAEYKTVAGNPDQGDINSERILLTIPQPFSNHNGGMIEFGRSPGDEDNLYIGMGDGGSANDPGNRAQNRSLLLGKMLRIAPDVPDGSPVPYLIPAGNPFTGANTARCDGGSTTPGNTCQEIWSIGMRNPWRWSIDKLTGELWAGDVGQFSVEEVDLITPGSNYGWRVYEGTSCTNLDPSLCIPSNYTMPVLEYSSSGTGNPRCSVTGGYVYRGTQGSLPYGSYVYADYCSGEVLLWHNGQQTILTDTPRNIVSFGEGEDGELYICYSNGTIDRITRASASADFDGDLRSDVSVFRPSSGVWYVDHSSNETFRIQQFGLQEDIPTPEDYDGDNITDIAVFRPSTGFWYYFRSGDNTVGIVPFGLPGDGPRAADYDGDNMADQAVFRPSEGKWYIRSSATGDPIQVQFGLNGDLPVPSDYDGDGRVDIAVFRPSSGDWWISPSSAPTPFRFVHWGQAGDAPVPGDYDGDGKTDTAVFRGSNGVWYISLSSTGATQITQWGTGGDIAAAGDYDGDGKDDLAVFRPSTGVWYVIRSSNASTLITQFGVSGDYPVPAFEIP